MVPFVEHLTAVFFGDEKSLGGVFAGEGDLIPDGENLVGVFFGKGLGELIYNEVFMQRYLIHGSSFVSGLMRLGGAAIIVRSSVE